MLTDMAEQSASPKTPVEPSSLLVVLSAAVLIVLVVAGLLIFKHFHKPSVHSADKTACQFITLADVRTVPELAHAKKASDKDISAAKLSSTADQTQSSCSYTSGSTVIGVLTMQAFTKKGQTQLKNAVTTFANGSGLTSSDAVGKVNNLPVPAYYNSQLHYLLLQKQQHIIEISVVQDTSNGTPAPADDQGDLLKLAQAALAKF
jgi:hypothetical protein